MSQAALPGPTVVAFVHADVIPMDRERVLRDHTVVTADRRIVEVGPASAVKVFPARAVRIDATGRYLLPAFADMHVHLLGEAWNVMLQREVQSASKDISFDDFLFPFIANGVTLVQSMSATPEELVVRERIQRGTLDDSGSDDRRSEKGVASAAEHVGRVGDRSARRPTRCTRAAVFPDDGFADGFAEVSKSLWTRAAPYFSRAAARAAKSIASTVVWIRASAAVRRTTSTCGDSGRAPARITGR
jgi:hypothetical protein